MAREARLAPYHRQTVISAGLCIQIKQIKQRSKLTMRRFSSLGHRLRGAALLRRETFDEAVGNTPLIKLQGPQVIKVIKAVLDHAFVVLLESMLLKPGEQRVLA